MEKDKKDTEVKEEGMAQKPEQKKEEESSSDEDDFVEYLQKQLGEGKSDLDVDEMDKLRQLFSTKFNLSTEPEVPPTKVLDELTLDGIVEYIKKKGCKNIITMAGAGISTAAGIPDFRSPNTGLYANLDKYKLPHPQAIFEINFFKKNPEPFFVLAKELLPEGFKPTVSHYFIRLLHEKGMLLRHYTQNIDTLERIAGLPYDKLVEAHGSFHTGKCLNCRMPYTLDWMKEQIKKGTVPKCEECTDGVVKPDIVFFGEQLPSRFHNFIDHDFRNADLLIVMGSSLVVQPFASLIDKVKLDCPRLLINKEKAGMRDRIAQFLGLKQGMVFDPKSTLAGRDVAWLGDCDEGCQLFADKMGWGDELKELYKKEHRRLDEELKQKSSEK